MIRCSIWTLPFNKTRFSQLNTVSAGIVPHHRFFSARMEESPQIVALNLMEQGVEQRNIQALLGHRDPKSTEVYLHVSNKSLMGIRSPFDRKDGTANG